MSNQAEAMMQHQIDGAISENEALRQEVERLKTVLAVVVRDWTQQFERNGHLAPAWVKQARAALGDCRECPMQPCDRCPDALGFPPAYPEGEVVGPCVCGSWPGGKCLRCPVTPNVADKRLP